jgi:drug/metabolite transporter (DMT)-like permease
LGRLKGLKNLSNQKKGSLLAFIAVMLITPDSIFIRLSNIETWGMLFYRGAIPFVVVLIGLIFFYKNNLLKALVGIGYPGIFYVISFSICNITFIISIQNTNVANTLVMIAMAPMLSAILGSIFLKEVPDSKTWIAIIITLIAVSYIFHDSIEMGNFYGDLFGLITAFGLACNAVIARFAKNRDLVPSAVIGKLCVAIFAFFFVDTFSLVGTDLIFVPLMCVMCVAIPFVLVTIAPRFIPAEEVNLFFLLETIIGPFWVWLIINEQPSIETIQGGIIILLTIAIHSFLKLKQS